MATRRIMISIDEQALDALTGYAVRRNTTVGGLVKAYLTRIAAGERRALEARERIRAMNREPQKDAQDQ